MSEYTPEAEQAQSGETFIEDFDAGFDEWIAGATIARRSIPIYADGGLMAEYQELLRKREIALEQDQGESSQGESDLDVIEAEIAALYERRELSKATWVVRALDSDDWDAIREVLPEPEAPDVPEEPTLHEKASPSQREAYKRAKAKYDEALPDFEAAVKKYETESTEYVRKLNLQIVWRGVDEIRFPNGKVTKSISLEQVEAVAKKIGRVQIGALVAEINKASAGEVDIPAPFSRTGSEGATT